MSKENLEQFMSKVADSEELQAKIGDVIDTDALIALGAECGCEFTAEQLKELALRRGNPHHWRKSFVQICNTHRRGTGNVYKTPFSYLYDDKYRTRNGANSPINYLN